MKEHGNPLGRIVGGTVSINAVIHVNLKFFQSDLSKSFITKVMAVLKVFLY